MSSRRLRVLRSPNPPSGDCGCGRPFKPSSELLLTTTQLFPGMLWPRRNRRSIVATSRTPSTSTWRTTGTGVRAERSSLSDCLPS